MDPYNILIIVGLILILIGIGVNIKFSFSKLWSFSLFRGTSESKLRKISRISCEKTRQIEEYKRNIFKNQMIYTDGVLKSLQKKCTKSEKDLFDSLKMIIRIRLIENGFENMSAVDFSNYVGDRIDEIRDYLMKNEEEYVMTPQFNDEIASIFTHARNTVEFWECQINNAEKELEKEIQKLIK